MKYKIGNTEVEVVQWNGDNFEDIGEFIECEDIHDDYWIETLEKSLYKELRIYLGPSIFIIRVGDYMVNTGKSIFKLNEQDFNNMATKVKEPKFKVGDVAYWVVQDDEICIEKVTITENIVNDNFVRADGHFHAINMKDLFTLEEAIEKLKKL